MTKPGARQAEVFKGGEGDAYFERTKNSRRPVSPETDYQLAAVVALFESVRQARVSDATMTEPSTLLEIGCGDGARLEWLAREYGLECVGVDPSAAAVESARARGVDAHVGTADSMPFERGRFDIVLFGFCLYLCDTEDLFRIAAEADRVLKPAAWLVIADFYSPEFLKVPYRHREGVYSHKMDYRSLFEWHPYYTCVKYVMGHANGLTPTDDRNESVAIATFRKFPR